mgnify:FL=1
MGEITGTVLNIERYTLHDGPGIRTTVFLKGCPLRCLWCSNPESQKSRPELVYFRDRCVGCGRCLEHCPHNALIQEAEGAPITVLFDRCDGCGICVDKCYYEALTIVGESMTAQDVCDIVARDQRFYKHSGGGVTLSGGEPLLQAEFSAEVLRLCQQKGIQTAIQTSGNAPLENLQRLIPHLDLVIFDCKHLDDQTHIKLTGVSNKRILENLHYLNAINKPVVIQVALIPGLNDSEENLLSVFDLVKSLPAVEGLSLLSYHTLGVSKYRNTGREYQLPDLQQASLDYLHEKMAFAEAHDVHLVRFNG